MYNNNKFPQNSLNNNPHINYPPDHMLYPQQNWGLPPGKFQANPVMAVNNYAFSNNFQPSHQSYSPSGHIQFLDNYNPAYSVNNIPPHSGFSGVRPVNVHNSQNRTHINYQNDVNSPRQNTNPLQLIFKALIQKQKQKPQNFMHQTNSLKISSSQKNKNGLEKNQSASCIPMYEQTTKQNEFYSTSSMTTKQILENMQKINQNNKMIQTSQSQKEIGNIKSSGKITESHYKSILAKQKQEQQNNIFDKVSKLQKDRSSRINKSTPSNSKRKDSRSDKQKNEQESPQQQQNTFMKKTNHLKVSDKQSQYQIRKTQSQQQHSYESINIQGTVVQKNQPNFNNSRKNMKRKIMSNYSLAKNIGRRQMGIQTNIQPEATKLYHSIYKFSQLLKHSKAYSKSQNSILAQKSQSPLEQRIQQFFDQHPELLEPPQIIIRMEQSVMNSIKSIPKKRKNNVNINISEKVKTQTHNTQSNITISRLPDAQFADSITTIKDEQQQQQEEEEKEKIEASGEIQESYDQSEVMQSFQEQKLHYRFSQCLFQNQNKNQNEINQNNQTPTMVKKSMDQSIKYTVNILDESKYKQSQHIMNKDSQIKTQQKNQPNLTSFVKQLYENLAISTSAKVFNMKTSFSELKQIVMFEFTQFKKYISTWMQEIIDNYEKALLQKEQTIFAMQIEKMGLENQLRQLKRKMENTLKAGNEHSLNSIKRFSDQEINGYIINKNSSCNKLNLLENPQSVTDRLKVKQSRTWKELNKLQQIISSQIYKIQASRDSQKPIKDIQVKMPYKLSQQTL